MPEKHGRAEAFLALCPPALCRPPHPQAPFSGSAAGGSLAGKSLLAPREVQRAPDETVGSRGGGGVGGCGGGGAGGETWTNEEEGKGRHCFTQRKWDRTGYAGL